MQHEITLYPDEAGAVTRRDEPEGEALFEPNGHRRCDRCRKRLHPFCGRLICVNPHCPGGSR